MRFLKYVRSRFYLHFQPPRSPKRLSAPQYALTYQGKGIKAILSVARSGLVRHSKEDIPYYLYIPAEDHEDYKLELHF